MKCQCDLHFQASSGPFQLVQQRRMNICANYTFQHKEPDSGEKKILIPFMATVHFTKYNSKWFIHSQGRASTTVVQITCPSAGCDEPDPKGAGKKLILTSSLGLWSPSHLKPKNCVTKLVMQSCSEIHYWGSNT